MAGGLTGSYTENYGTTGAAGLAAPIPAGGAGTPGATTTPGGAGGGAPLTAGAGGAKTDTGNAAGGAGGNAPVTAGAGGNTASSGTDAGGAGGDCPITAGAGGNATAGTGNGGAGGSIPIVPGAGGTSAGGSAGVPGCVYIGGVAGAAAFALNVTRSTITDAAVITDAQIRGQVLYQNAGSGSVTMTTRTGTQMSAAFPDLAVGNAIPLFLASNHAANTSTIAGGVDVTLVGSGAVTQIGGTFLLIKTASTTWDLVRVG